MADEILELRQLLHEKNKDEELRQSLKKFHPNDLAKSFSELNDSERQVVYEVLDEEDIAEIFSYLDEMDAARFLQEMSYTQGADVLTEMPPDDAADILNELEDDKHDYLIQMEPEDAKELSGLSSLDEDTAGSIMSTEFIKILIGTDVKEATRILGYEAHDAETIDPLFVVDNNNKLIGIVKLQDLITSRTPLKIDEIMNDNFIYGLIDEDKEAISKKITDYDVYALPILDESGIIKGIVTMDDALEVASDSIDEDYTKMAAVSNDDDLPFIKNILGRLPWLIILLAISLIISNITAKFEGVIEKVTVLWFFNTMILDMAGNTGTQNLAVAVRKLGRGELNDSHKTFLYVLKELLTTLINALILGIFSFGVTYLFIKLLNFDEGINAIYAALTISTSLSITLLITGMFGTLIPLLMNKVHIDPAIASGPLITTLNDIIAMVIYFGLASIMMPLILG